MVAGLSLFFPAVFPLKQIRIPVTPLYHGVDNRDKGLSQWRNGIFGTWRQFGKDGFGHQAVLHQLLQLNVQYTGSSLGEKFVKLTGAQRTMTQAHWGAKDDDAVRPEYTISIWSLSDSWSGVKGSPSQREFFFHT